MTSQAYQCIARARAYSMTALIRPDCHKLQYCHLLAQILAQILSPTGARSSHHLPARNQRAIGSPSKTRLGSPSKTRLGSPTGATGRHHLVGEGRHHLVGEGRHHLYKRSLTGRWPVPKFSDTDSALLDTKPALRYTKLALLKNYRYFAIEFSSHLLRPREGLLQHSSMGSPFSSFVFITRSHFD